MLEKSTFFSHNSSLGNRILLMRCVITNWDQLTRPTPTHNCQWWDEAIGTATGRSLFFCAITFIMCLNHWIVCAIYCAVLPTVLLFLSSPAEMFLQPKFSLLLFQLYLQTRIWRISAVCCQIILMQIEVMSNYNRKKKLLCPLLFAKLNILSS